MLDNKFKVTLGFKHADALVFMPAQLELMGRYYYTARCGFSLPANREIAPPHALPTPSGRFIIYRYIYIFFLYLYTALRNYHHLLSDRSFVLAASNGFSRYISIIVKHHKLFYPLSFI